MRVFGRERNERFGRFRKRSKTFREHGRNGSGKHCVFSPSQLSITTYYRHSFGVPESGYPASANCLSIAQRLVEEYPQRGGYTSPHRQYAHTSIVEDSSCGFAPSGSSSSLPVASASSAHSS